MRQTGQGGCEPAWSGTLGSEYGGYIEDGLGGEDDLTVPDEVGDVLDGLQVVRLLRIREGLLLQSLGVVT